MMPTRNRSTCLAVLLALLAVLAFRTAEFSAAGEVKAVDPLPSWKEGKVKQQIVAYVKAVTDKNSRDYIPTPDRIATFDNDGTLWCEMPLVEAVFSLSRLKTLAAKSPDFKEKQPYKAALEGDREFLHKAGMKALLELLAATHGNLPQSQFDTEAANFFQTEKHPRFNQTYPQMTYAPMTELLRYLRANGFQTWICSGGSQDLMRAMTAEAYGIPPQQVIGSSLKKTMREQEGQQILWIQDQLLTICDHDDKPVDIALHIGKRPVFAAGNVRTGGDIAMLRYSQGSSYRSLQLMVNHDDAEREYAYAETSRASLNAAEQYGWNVVSMKGDWQKVFSFEK